MSTALDVIKGSLRLIGAIATGETPSAAESTDALYSFNRMIDSWSTENLIIPAILRETFTLIPGQAAYTMGTIGTPSFNTARPLEIKEALLQIVGSNPLAEIPMEKLNVHQFAEIKVKPVQSTIPTRIYAEGTFPNETLNLWPVPSAANVLVLYSEKPLTNIAALTTVITFPTGYEDALVSNLAVKISPEYGKAVSPDLQKQADDAKANIKRQNIKPLYMECGNEMVQAGGFNIYTWGVR